MTKSIVKWPQRLTIVQYKNKNVELLYDMAWQRADCPIECQIENILIWYYGMYNEMTKWKKRQKVQPCNATSNDFLFYFLSLTFRSPSKMRESFLRLKYFPDRKA